MYSTKGLSAVAPQPVAPMTGAQTWWLIGGIAALVFLFSTSSRDWERWIGAFREEPKS